MRPALAALLALPLATPALAVDTHLQLTIDLPGNAQRDVVTYECPGHDPLTVDYINAEPLFLAMVPIDGEPQIFVNVIAASGARYVSGQWEWWTKGPDATLTDITAGEDAAPLECAQVSLTP